MDEFWPQIHDFLLSDFVTISELRSFWLECTLKLRHLFFHTKKLWDGVQESCRYHLRRWRTLLCETLPCLPCSSELASLEVFCKFGVLQVTDVHQIRELNCFFHPSSPDVWHRTWILLSWRAMVVVSSVFILFIRWCLIFWHLHCLLNGNWLVYRTTVKTSRYLFIGDVVHMFSLHFPACSSVFWIWLFLTGINWICNCLRFTSAVFSRNAQHSKNSLFFQFQTSVINHLEVISVSSQYLVDPLLRRAACLQLALPSANCAIRFPSVSWEKLTQTPGQKLSSLVEFWIFRKSSISPTCILQEVLYVRSGIFHFSYSSEFVSLLQSDRECFTVWVVKLQTRSFMMSLNKFATHGRRIFFVSDLFCRLLRFQHHLAASSVCTRKFVFSFTNWP